MGDVADLARARFAKAADAKDANARDALIEAIHKFDTGEWTGSNVIVATLQVDGDETWVDSLQSGGAGTTERIGMLYRLIHAYLSGGHE